MADLLHRTRHRSMSAPNRRDSSRAVRAVSNAPHDARARRSPDGQIPSFVTPIRSGSPAPIANRSAASGPAAGGGAQRHPVHEAARDRGGRREPRRGGDDGARRLVLVGEVRSISRSAPPDAAPRHAADADARGRRAVEDTGSPAPSVAERERRLARRRRPHGAGDPPRRRAVLGVDSPHPVKAVAQTAAPLPAAIAVTAWPAPSGASRADGASRCATRAARGRARPYAAHAAPRRPRRARATRTPTPTPVRGPRGHAAPAALPRSAAQMAIVMPAADLERPTQVQPAPVPQKWSVYNALGLGPPKLRLPSSARSRRRS